MTNANAYTVNPGWKVILADLGIRPGDVLRRAGLPDDLFSRERAYLNTDEYFRFWRGIEQEANDPLLPIRVGKVLTVEAFDPPLFAAMCSPNLKTALKRISQYKRLIGPMAIHLKEGDTTLTMELEWLDATIPPPVILATCELAFFVSLARIATRERIVPIKITTSKPPALVDPYLEFFGVRVQKDSAHSITFSTYDAERPFMTFNDPMWKFFEPNLRKRLTELDETATMTDRVKGALLEMLPSGNSSIEDVSKRLKYSTRTLQRKLSAEGGSFQTVLNKTREDLATHYLVSSSLSGAEISFLLGYADPNSFFRAFQSWTGQTPDSVRSSFRN